MENKIEVGNTREKKFIFLDQFVFAEADANYSDVYMTNGTIHRAIRIQLGELAELIEKAGTYQEHHIFRAAKKYIINTDYLVAVNTTKSTITMNIPTGSYVTLEIKKPESKRLLQRLDREKRLQVLQTYSHRQKLTVPVSTLNDTDDEYVDLRLPSGTLWASHNLDASAPESAGNLYKWNDCKSMKLPTREQIKELEEECVWTFCLTQGCNGCLVMGPNGNVIFLPCAGYCKDGEYTRDGDVKGLYWTSEQVNSESAYSLSIQESESEPGILEGLDDKELAYSVRLVK